MNNVVLERGDEGKTSFPLSFFVYPVYRIYNNIYHAKAFATLQDRHI